MAMEVGADLANMTEAWWYPASSIPGEEYDGRPLARFVGVERTAPHSIMVDRFGYRFVNEAANYNDMQKAFFSFDANEYSSRHLPCWVVFDHQYRSRYGAATCGPVDPDPDWLPVHDTVEGLAESVGIDPVGLAATVERWNRLVRDGKDRDFGRGASAYDRFHGDPTAPHPNLGTIEQGPLLRPARPHRVGGDQGRAAGRRPRTDPTRPRSPRPRSLRGGQRDRQPGRTGVLRGRDIDRHGRGVGPSGRIPRRVARPDRRPVEVDDVPVPTVRVEPDGHVIPVGEGESLIEAAWRQGYDWPTTCYGQARCTACHVEVVSGGEHAAPATDGRGRGVAHGPAPGPGAAAGVPVAGVRRRGRPQARGAGPRAQGGGPMTDHDRGRPPERGPPTACTSSWR